ncbi:putative secreted protein (Por secretion system target) [Dyadobacter jejuensis]|uniref:Putative secreted protein (Por secretion system target) n=1 Tax=Dyadobacter jejuensis TaxID=1082580 RepID=A0A316ANV3_9BACT|nr:right-handed parallel beta-helix repeat-containing protein [Dyadobacter jejuensis]PWJ59373.1 putative secreted protein (Por secretion system target) [Dyadobacter jejuensis]
MKRNHFPFIRILMLLMLGTATSYAQKIIYLNDAATTDDRFTTAIGDDAAMGATPSTPVATLTRAMSLASAGDRIMVDAGSYMATSLSIKAGVSLIGLPDDKSILNAHTGAIILNSNTQLWNLKIQRTLPPNPGHPSISVATASGSSNILIENCTFYKNRTAIYLEPGSTDITVKRCRFDDNRTGVIFPGSASATTLSKIYLIDNDLSNNRSYGLILTDNTNSPVEMYLSGNNITGNLASGIEIDNTHANTKLIMRNNWLGKDTPDRLEINTNGGFSVPDHDTEPGTAVLTNSGTIPGATYPNDLSGSATSAIVALTELYAASANPRPATNHFIHSNNTNLAGHADFAFFPSIADAISASNTDATITLPDGLYSDNVVINKKVNLVGTSQNNTIVRGTYDKGIQGAVMTISAAGAKVSQLTVTRDYGQSEATWKADKMDSGISIGANDVILDGLTVKDQRSGIYVYNRQNFQIINSLIEQNRTGLSFGVNISGGQVLNNLIRDNFTHGLIFNHAFGSGITANNFTLRHNRFSGNWLTDVYAHGTGATSEYATADLSCNAFTTNSPLTTISPAGEPGYDAQTTSQFGGSSPGFVASFAGDKIGNIKVAPWLVNVAAPAPSATSFVLSGAPLNVAPVTPPLSASNNDYRILANAIGCVLDNQTIDLAGTFDWTTTEAQEAWAKGTDAILTNGSAALSGTGDDYSITPTAAVNGVTLTSSTSATIQGPGDLTTTSLESFLFLNSKPGSSYQNWTISNLTIKDFDVAILADHNGGPTTVLNDLKILNNQFYIPADPNSIAAPNDGYQNIGVHYTFGKNIEISGNEFVMDGTGESADSESKYSTSIGLQSTTSGGTVYDGLQIRNNTFSVTGLPSAQPAIIRGIWENGSNENAAMDISGNKFTNVEAGNTANLNRQTAFWVTSRSGSAKKLVYQNNEVSGFMEGIAWIGGSFTSYNPPVYNTGAEPVLVTNNKFNDVQSALVVRKSNSSTNTGSPAEVHQNSFTGSVLFDIVNEASGETNASCNWFGEAPKLSNTGGGTINTSPKLLSGTDDDPGLTGFQTASACEYPVKNLRTLQTFATIQAAIDDIDTQDGDELLIANGIYTERVALNKKLKLTGESEAGTILDGSTLAGTGSAIYIGADQTDVMVQKLTIQNYAGINGNQSAGIYALRNNNNLTIKEVTIKNNSSASGIYANGPIDGVLIDDATLQNNGAGARGIVLWNGLKTNITVQNSLVENNDCCGIELQDGSASGVLIKGNTIVGKDNAIGMVGLTSGAGPNIIEDNIITVNGRFGIELKNPNGTGNDNDTEDGAIIVRNNTVTFGATTDLRDLAGIAVYRRGVASAFNVDIPTGVVVKSNTVTGFVQGNAGSNSEGFGIVVEGTNHKVLNNTLSGNTVDIQRQAGHTPYTAGTTTDGDQGNLSDMYFGRGNAPYSCDILVDGNTGNPVRDVTYQSGPGVVVNTNTGKTFCSLQRAINDAATVDGHELKVADGTFTENVTVTKSLSIVGKNGGASVVQLQAPSSGTGNGITVSVPNVSLRYLKVTDYNYGVVLNSNANHLLIEDADISNNKAVGIRTGTSTANISNLTVRNSLVKHNGQGMTIYGSTATGANVFDAVNIISSDFSDNATKGIYIERASNLLIDDVLVHNSGTSPSNSSNNGIDINLKYGAFENIRIQNSTITNSGLTGTATDPEAPAAVTIKARRDGSYSVSPASLSGVVLYKNTIGGPQNGVRIGEPGKIDDGTSGVSLEQNDLSLSYSGKALINRTASDISLTCNWFGLTDLVGINAKIMTASTGLNTILSTSDDAAFSNCVDPVAPTEFWVNDISLVGDVLTSAIGDDANPGTAALPFLTINHAISVAASGNTIHIDAGTYVEDVVIDKALKLFGANKDINPISGVRLAETILMPATNDPVDGSILSIQGALDGVRIEGLTLNGDNTALAGGESINGIDVNVGQSITAYDGVSNTLIRHNRIKNLNYAGISIYNYTNAGAATSGNVIEQNSFDNIVPSQFGIGILLYNNAYCDIVDNSMTRVRIGVQTGNFSKADPGDSHSITGNTISSVRRGIWHNLAYQNAANFSITGNTISAVPGSSRHDGIMLSSLQNTVGATVEDNLITGIAGVSHGYMLWNNPSNLVTIKGGTVSDVYSGIYANNYEGYPDSGGSNAKASTYTVDQVQISGAQVGIKVNDNPDNSLDASVKVIVKGTTSILLPLGKGIEVSGNNAQIELEDVQIQMSPSTTEAISLALTPAATLPNLTLHAGLTVDRNANLTAPILKTSAESIVEMGSNWTIPTGGPSNAFQIQGQLKFTNGILNAENTPVTFGPTATDVLEKSSSHILGTAIMEQRAVGTAAIQFLGVHLPSGADLGQVEIIRTTSTTPITPIFGAGAVKTLWTINPTNAGVGRDDVTFSVLQDYMNSQSPSELYGYRYNGSIWEKKSGALTTVVSGDQYTTSAFAISEFSPWTLSSAPDPLPVVLVSFQASLVEHATVLNWSTVAETNSSEFVIEHSMDGKNWQSLGLVKAQGESMGLQPYQFTHANPSVGNNLYRLKMVDLDDSFAYSRLVNVEIKNTFSTNIYPNPAAEQLNVKVEDWTKVKQIRIIDMLGKVHYQSGDTPTPSIMIDKMGSGVYLIEITKNDQSRITSKVVIAR